MNETRARGFTLVELMIVVAIIGVLAALAIYGVQMYLASSKASEAKQMIGRIARSATAAYEREITSSQTVGEGSQSKGVAHALCDSAVPVPATVPKGRKYQPKTGSGNDFDIGTPTAGWVCLRFTISEPIQYQFRYTRNASPAAPNNGSACKVAPCFEAAAIGDLNNNGLFSRFALTGHVNLKTGAVKKSSQIYSEAEFE